MIHDFLLPNGPRLLLSPLPTQAVTVLVLVGAGSRYEAFRERGIAHFLEHMFFKGGKVYDTPKKVSETIDAIGGDFNAFTGKEYAGYYVKCAGKDIRTAFAVLGDMLTTAKLDLADIDRERGVILEEMRMYEDAPMYQVGWDFEHLLFGENTLGWDQIGLPENIRSFSREDFQKFKADLYTADNTVVVVSGALDVAEATDLAKEFFPFSEAPKKARVFAPLSAEPDPRLHIRKKTTEQAHLVLGFPGVSRDESREYTARLLAIILGGNMSSRMFLRIREEKGLCYSIHTSTDHYSDAGVISTHAGVDLSRAEEALAAMIQEYEAVREKGVLATELQKAKSFLQGKLTLKLEDSEEMASFFGTQAILGKKICLPEELFSRIERVSLEDVHCLAKELFAPEARRLSLIGPFDTTDEEKLLTILRS